MAPGSPAAWVTDAILAERLASSAVVSNPAPATITDADLDALPVYGARPDPFERVPADLERLI